MFQGGVFNSLLWGSFTRKKELHESPLKPCVVHGQLGVQGLKGNQKVWKLLLGTSICEGRGGGFFAGGAGRVYSFYDQFRQVATREERGSREGGGPSQYSRWNTEKITPFSARTCERV